MTHPPLVSLDANDSAPNPNLRAVVAEPARPLSTLYTPSSPSAAPRIAPWSRRSIAFLLLLWAAIFLCASATPSLLDDADATHAQAAQAMLHTGDWVTLHVNGVRYLEKPPLPYWIAACSLRAFGENSFAIHLPLALTVLGLALLGYAWSRRAFSERAAFYTALFTLTSTGVFLFTRVFIPDALLSLLLALSIYAALRALEPSITPFTRNSALTTKPGAPHLAETWVAGTANSPGAPSTRVARAPGSRWAYLLWAALACAVLTKGLVAIVFVVATVGLFLILTGDWRRWRRLHPFTGVLLFLAIAAPWHVLAALRNPAVPMPTNSGFPSHAGWTWFYLYNEHVARFLGTRVPRDYNKLPAALYWLLHIVWLFPWSLFFPAAIALAWSKRHRLRQSSFRTFAQSSFAARTILLLSIFSAIILSFFSLSTNQEYYTFPVYLPLLILTAAALAHIESESLTTTRTVTFAHATFTILGLAIGCALAYGLWTSRHLPFVPDIGSLLAHRDVGGYTLSMSHFFDLTGPSFAALRLPAALAGIAFAIGPLTAWLLRAKSRAPASTITIAVTAATFLIAAHIALVRFAPMLSSRDFASTIQQLESDHGIATDTQVMIYGDQAFGSSIPFYLDQHVFLVDGRSTSMLFGSLFPDAPHLFLTSHDLLAQWGHGPRKILFVPLEQRDQVDHLLGPHQILLHEASGKALITDRPLDSASASDASPSSAPVRP